jgi:protein SCO1/2
VTIILRRVAPGPFEWPRSGAPSSPGRRWWIGLAVALASLAIAGCGSSSSPGPVGTNAGQVSGSGLQGLILKPRKPAPPLALHNFTGQSVSLAGLRGRAVLVTFVYTHCPDVCPIIVSNLAAAQRGLGAEARRVKILAVTVDPKRDTPPVIRTYLRARDALGRMDYLLGSTSQLHRTWKDWDVGVSTGTDKLTNGHSSITYGITASGRMAVVYPANFTPQQIIHDVPLLASS